MSFGSQLFVTDEQTARQWFAHTLAFDTDAQETLEKQFLGDYFATGLTQTEIGMLHATLTGQPYDLTAGGEELIGEDPEGAWLLKISPKMVNALTQCEATKEDIQLWRKFVRDLLSIDNPNLKLDTANAIIKLCRTAYPDKALFLYYAG